jgi:hypothetical protein
VIAPRRSASDVQSGRRRSEQVVTSRLLCILVRAHHNQEMHGLLALLHSDRRPPDLTIRHHTGKLLTTATRVATIDDRSRGTASDRITEACRQLEPASRPRSWTPQLRSDQIRKDHAATIRNFDFKAGTLVLIRNTAIKKALNRKMRPRYLGPLVVVSHVHHRRTGQNTLPQPCRSIPCYTVLCAQVYRTARL